jgi:uncharacterized protein YbaP (TraB family)
MGIKGIVKRNRIQLLVIGILILLAALWASISTASAQAGTQSQPGSHPGQKKDFMWSVKTPKATVYLLGSLHLLKADAYPLDKNIEAAYRVSKTICFETDIGTAKDPAYQSQLLAQGMYPEGQTLQQDISLETYGLLEKRATAMGISMDQLNRLRPWACALTLDAVALMRMGFDPQYGVDVYFFDKAKKDGKEMLFLETPDFQMRLFTGLTNKEGDTLLRQTLKELEVIETMLPDMLNAWKTGDAARLGAIMTMSFQDFPDSYSRFILQRNKAWMNTIEQLLAQGGTTMLVVGAGHLAGPENLLQLLKDRGYTIQQVAASAEIAAENLAHALYIRSGVEQEMRNLPIAMQLGFDQMRNQDERMQQIPQDVYVRIKELIAEAFVAEHLNAIVLRQMEAQLRQDEMQGILAWLNSPFGKKCTDLYKASLTPKTPAELKEFLTKIRKAPASPNRLKLIRELAAVTRARELALEIAVHTRLAVTTVLADTLPSVQKRPFSEILDEADKNRPLLESPVDQQITPLLIYTYRPLSDAELARYIAFARSSLGARYHRSMLNGIKLAVMDASIRFGSAMADMQWKRKQGAGAPEQLSLLDLRAGDNREEMIDDGVLRYSECGAYQPPTHGRSLIN